MCIRPRNFTLFFGMIFVLQPNGLQAEDLKPIKRKIGDMVGVVTKVDENSISIEYPQIVQSGVTRRRVRVGRSSRYISIPKYTKKTMQQTFDIAKDVEVKRLGAMQGSTSSMSDVTVGETVHLVITRVTERNPGGKPDVHIDISKIELPKLRK